MQAIACLPPRLMGEAMRASKVITEQAEEVRLRCGQPVSIVCGNREICVGELTVEQGELRELLARAARYSVHSHSEDLARGFLPLEGGHRLGLCGTIARSGGVIVGYRVLSSACIRVAQDIPGVSDAVISTICSKDLCKSTMIVAPPGIGKTTLLRDMIRACSLMGHRVGVADERSELAAMRGGIPQFDLGPCTDVIEGADKADAVIRLIRTMSPQIVAMDEVTEEKDLAAIRTAAHCGVSILATVHGVDAEELEKKRLFRELLDQQIFERLIIVNRKKGVRSMEVKEL